MSKYIIRLDDACEKRNIKNWDRIEKMLEHYNIKPLVGIIPNCKDPMMNKYSNDENFNKRVREWLEKGWIVALHGYNHVYSTNSGGINPINYRSEFAGESLAIQKEKIRKGVAILKNMGINPQVFFAPSHTFDKNTIIALQEESDIRIISDTIAYNSYEKYGMTFVPQQSGRVRKLPFKLVTFCYHPNTMSEKEFINLEHFIKKYNKKFISFPLKKITRKKNIIDKMLERIYFVRRK
mgnify:CR=1 FL=1